MIVTIVVIVMWTIGTMVWWVVWGMMRRIIPRVIARVVTRIITGIVWMIPWIVPAPIAMCIIPRIPNAPCVPRAVPVPSPSKVDVYIHIGLVGFFLFFVLNNVHVLRIVNGNGIGIVEF